jgi:hypothetical protein
VVRGGDASSGLHKLEIAITDQDGRVCARLSGFSSRMVRQELPDRTKRSDVADRQDVAKLTLPPPSDAARLTPLAAMVEPRNEKPQRIVLRPLEPRSSSAAEIAPVQVEVRRIDNGVRT